MGEFSSKIQLKATMQRQPNIKKQRRRAARIKMPDFIRQTEDGHLISGAPKTCRERNMEMDKNTEEFIKKSNNQQTVHEIVKTICDTTPAVNVIFGLFH